MTLPYLNQTLCASTSTDPLDVHLSWFSVSLYPFSIKCVQSETFVALSFLYIGFKENFEGVLPWYDFSVGLSNEFAQVMLVEKKVPVLVCEKEVQSGFVSST